MTGSTDSPELKSEEQKSEEQKSSQSRRLKSLTIFAVVIWSALVFLAWSQPWFTLSAQGRAGDTISVTVQGAAAAPALSALALAGLALAAALAIAGPVVRIVLGVLEFVLGASILASTIGALSNPVLAGQSAVTTATGVTGNSSVQAIATTSGSSLWPYLALVAGTLMALTGILIVITMRRWPVSGRKYQPVQFAAADGRTAGNPVDLISDEAQFDEAELDDADAEADAEADLDRATDTSVADTSDQMTGIDEVARAAAVDKWDSLSRGQDPTA
ncbi:Trp biosynthesis-associated membrane protein [Subtercola endophyticus]|uniref:Trp biosynthesis-associated membrane protein n=1 Tax=Subtercola endophyticus TaxID=2895559 RepID=UPI001E471D4E|nr:Trp biosynthesis-associated membrane protein [Subtercola endophyticus]UFS60309.1 Trp biosynthesis-associated membrane protein [Subtercola endophyticus]